jgi:PAS domain S-box-containing protein
VQDYLVKGQTDGRQIARVLRYAIERQRIEEALRRSETKYRTVADNTYNWEWWRDPEGNFVYVSPSCLRITGHAADEFMADTGLLLRIMHPDDRPSFASHLAEVEERMTAGEIEFRILRPDGSARWLAHACQPVFDEHGHVLGRRGSNRDITERKRAEESLRESEHQLRSLSSQILTAQETERRRIAREIHDEMGGALAVLKLRTSQVERSLPDNRTDLKEELRRNLTHIDDIIENARRLSRDLSPSILEDIGLTPALRWLVDNFIKNYRIQVAFDIVNVDHLFPKDSQIMIYRVFQEALANVGKHARAANVSAKVQLEADTVSFIIEDDGRGFDLKSARAKEDPERGLGLVTMDERARMLRGSLEIKSGAGKGTRVTLIVPLIKGEKD